MFLVIPIGNDTSLKRLPWVTIGIIVVTILAYAFLPRAEMKELDRKAASLQQDADYLVHSYVLVQYPEMENEFSQHKRDSLSFLEDFPRWGRNIQDQKIIHTINQLFQREAEIWEAHPYYRYGFVPAKPSWKTLVTHLFMHAGFFHMFFNMLFLWAVGCNLEDSWGPLFYGIFYFVAGFAAIGVHGLLFSQSMEPCIGASGAIAALMGAFMIRHCRSRMRVLFIYFLAVVPRVRDLSVRAYYVLPLWFLEEIFYGLMTLKINIGVASWAHIGGFAFGCIVAYAVKFFDLENYFPGAAREEISQKRIVSPARKPIPPVRSRP